MQRYRERQLKAPWQPDYALQRQLEAIRTFDTCDRLAQIKTPTLILTADRDLLVPPGNGRILANRIPGAELETFTGGHLIYLESANAFHQRVERFFQGPA